MARRSISQLQAQQKSESAYSHFNDDGDGLDDIEQAMGEDFGFGFDPDQDDPNLRPRVPDAPSEVVAQRTANSIAFQFPAHNQLLESLCMQAISADQVANAADPFASYSVMKRGCLAMEIPDPQRATGCTFGELSAGVSYHFRLVARNPKGSVVGKCTPAIATLEYAPARGEFSSFLWAFPPVEMDKKRRLSFRGTTKTKPDYVWAVLEGQLLTWADSVDGKELGRVMMVDVKCVVSEEGKADSTRIVIQDTRNREYNFEVESRNPNISSPELCRAWLTRLRQILALSPGDFGKSTNTAMLM